MTSKKKSKGKTMALSEFLGEDSKKLVTVRGSTWSEIVDSEEAETRPIVVDIRALPDAPRAAFEVDYSNLPNIPPFIAYVANLSFDTSDEGLRRIFAELNPKSAQVLVDGRRSRGAGLVEFETLEALIAALKKDDNEVYGRKIRVSVSDKTDSHNEGGRGSFNNYRSNRGPGEERPELSGKWARGEQRPDSKFDDRPSSGFNRDRTNREQGRPNMSGGSRDNQNNSDYGFGYPRSKDDRGVNNRQGQRNRYHDDDNRQNNATGERPRYAGRYSDTRDTRERNQQNDTHEDAPVEPQRERPKLQLQPRTKPLEEAQPLSGSSSSVNNVAANSAQSISNQDDSSPSKVYAQTGQSPLNDDRVDDSKDNAYNQQSTVKSTSGAGSSIFGGAKPVDTAARELEIEKKLQELKTQTSETTVDDEEKGSTAPPRPPHNRNDREYYRSKRPSNNDDRHNRDRREEGRTSHGGDNNQRRDHDNYDFGDDGRKQRHSDDPHHRRGGYGGPSRRDHESGRTSKYNHHNNAERDNERNNNRQRDRDSHEFITQGRSSNNNSNIDAQGRNQPRGTTRRTLQKDDDSNRLQLSNKFCMLDEDNDNNHDEDEDEVAQSPSLDE